MVATGARVRNAYAIYPQLGHSPGKPGLISHSILDPHGEGIKAQAVEDEHASD
jgi:hypothetical protein